MNELINLVEKGDEAEIIEYFLKKEIIQIPPNGNKKENCKNNPLVIRKRNNVGDDLWWRSKFLSHTSVRKNSFLSMFKLPLNEIIKLIFDWVAQLCSFAMKIFVKLWVFASKLRRHFFKKLDKSLF